MQRLFQLYDKVARAVEGPIIPYRADGPAIRMFHDVLKNPQTNPGQHPGDFDLVCVGEQDDQGLITPLAPPVPVALGAAWLEQRNRDSLVDNRQLTLMEGSRAES